MVLMRAVLWAMLALMFSATAHARLLLITSQETAIYQEFQQGLNGVLAKGLAQQLEVRQAGEIAAMADFSAYSAIVVAGVEAAKALAQRGGINRPVLYTMLPLSSYQWLGDNRLLAAQHKALCIDQPPYRYIQLARAAMPEMRSIAYLYGDASAIYLDELKKAAEAASLGFVAGDFSASARLSELLKESFSKSDAVLLLPDPYLYNRRAVQELLLASFRHKRPLVVYSESFLKAGAMLALFSTPEQIGRQTAEVLNCAGQPCYSATPQLSYPKYFSVVVNEAVARQFGVEIKGSAELQRYLESVEASRPH